MGDPDQDHKNSSPHANPGGRGQDHTADIWVWEGAVSPGVDHQSFWKRIAPHSNNYPKRLALLMGTSLFYFHGNLTVGRGRRLTPTVRLEGCAASPDHTGRVAGTAADERGIHGER